MSDPSNGYEAIAAEFLAGRGNSKTREIAVGVRTVQAWAKTVRPGVGREFDGVIAWGLLFLLQPAVQAQLIGQVAHALVRGGRFVFTAPRDACVWNDAMTGRR